MKTKNNLCCLNTAIEATSLNTRACCLPEQDCFIRDNICENDYLVVSIGGNDIALSPLLCTILNMLILSWCTPKICVEKCSIGCPPNLGIECGCLDCGLVGCITGLFSGWPIGMGYFINLFKNRIENYVKKLVSKKKPRKVIICMI